MTIKCSVCGKECEVSEVSSDDCIIGEWVCKKCQDDLDNF